MPGSITTDFTTVNNADAIVTGWTFTPAWSTTQVLDNDMWVQGTGCAAGRISALIAWGVASITAVDMSTGAHVFLWAKCITWPSAATQSAGGLRVGVSSGTVALTTNNLSTGKTWYVDGSDTASTSGWVCYVIDPQSTPDITNATYTITSTTNFGVGFDITGTVGGGSFKPHNCAIDLIKYGTGLTINNGTSAAPVAFSDIYSSDSNSSNAYGVITQQSSIYYGAGKLNFGTSGQSAITYFVDKNQVLVFQPFPVANSFYAINTVGAASFSTTFQLGDYTNSIASGGCTIRGATSTGIGAPGSAASGTAVTGAGLSIGNYRYKITYVTSVGETSGGTESATITTTTGNQQISLTSIPTYSTTSRVIARNIYRTKVGGASGTELFVHQIADNTTTTYTDSTADSSLGRPIPIIDTTRSSAWTLSVGSNSTANLYGCVFSNMRPSTLNSSSAMQSCSISNSGEITTNGATINGCTFTDVLQQAPISGTYALIIASTTQMAAVTNCSFVNCNRAIKITAAGTYTFSGLTFSGNNYDIENSSSGAVTINATNGSNPGTFINTGGGSVTINNAVTISVTVQTAAGTAIQNARVAIYKSNNILAGQELVNGLTNSSGVVSSSFNYTSNQNIVVRVRAETPLLSTPAITTFGTAGTGGNLSNGTYYYRVSATNDLGETLASTEQSTTISAGTSTQTITINWGAVTDATGYKIYGRSTGAEQFIASVGATTTYTDTGSITPSGALPASNTTGTIRYLPIDSNGVITTSGYTALFSMTLDSIASSSAL